MDTVRVILGVLGLGMFVIGALVLKFGDAARRFQGAGSGIGCLTTVVAVGLIFGGLGFMGVGGFLIEGSSAKGPAPDAGAVATVATAAAPPRDAGRVVDAGRGADASARRP